MPDATDFQHRVAQLRARFDERLDRESAEILSLAQAQSLSVDRLERIRFLAHGLRGSAATFGRTDAGAVAAELENLSAGLLAHSEAAPKPDRMLTLARQLRHLPAKGEST